MEAPQRGPEGGDATWKEAHEGKSRHLSRQSLLGSWTFQLSPADSRMQLWVNPANATQGRRTPCQPTESQEIMHPCLKMPSLGADSYCYWLGMSNVHISGYFMPRSMQASDWEGVLHLHPPSAPWWVPTEMLDRWKKTCVHLPCVVFVNVVERARTLGSKYLDSNIWPSLFPICHHEQDIWFLYIFLKTRNDFSHKVLLWRWREIYFVNIHRVLPIDLALSGAL